MAGSTDYLAAGNLAALTNSATSSGMLGYVTGQNFGTGATCLPALPAVWLGLFTVAPTTELGTSYTGTEASGNGYARVQIAGTMTTTALTAGSGTLLTNSSLPTWIQAAGSTGGYIGAGAYLHNITHPTSAYFNGATTISSVTNGASLVFSPAAGGSGISSGDTIGVAAFAPPVVSSGAAPVTVPPYTSNASAIQFPQATSTGWGTVVAWGLFDASTSGDLIFWDWLGNYKWVPCTVSAANPAIITVGAAADAYANGTSVVFSNKAVGGTQVTWSTPANLQVPVTTAGLSGNTFNVGQQATVAGEGLIRQVTTQAIAGNVTASFAAGQFILSWA